MQFLFEFLPLLLFFAGYVYKDIYFAVGVLMIAMPVGLLLQWLVYKKVSKMFAGSTALAVLLGGTTLLLHDPVFLYWKPTVMFWIIAALLLGSQFIGEKPLVQRAVEATSADDDKLAIASLPINWRMLNVIWSLFFASIGLLNIYVAKNFSEALWVKFKVFGIMGILFAFIVIQMLWLVMNTQNETKQTDDSEN